MAILVWAVFAGAMLIGSLDRVTSLDLADSDDYMRLAQVQSWLNHGDWHDLTEERINPPAGVTLHWSRLPDIPIAAVISAARHFTDDETAATLALIIVPSLYLLGFLLLVTWIAARTIGRRAAPLAAVMAAFAVPATAQFMPGRIDHHGLQIVLAMVMLAGIVRILQGARGAWPAITGIAIALALAVGVEALPHIAAAYAALALAWIAGRGDMLRPAVVMSLAAAAGSALILLLAVPRNTYFAGACDSLSLAYGTGIALVAGAIVCLYLCQRWLQTGLTRSLAAVAALGIAAVATLTAYPECAAGPYAALPEDVTSVWLESVGEAQNAFTFAREDILGFVLYFMLPLIGLWVCIRGLIRQPDQPHWLPLLVFLLAATIVALIQIRAANVANAIAIIAALPFYFAVYRWTGERVKVLPRLASISAILVVSPAVIYAIGSAVMAPDPASAKSGRPCPIPSALTTLKGMDLTVIMTPSNLGPVILAHTSHSIIGAPYHRNASGLRATLEFFMASDSDKAREAIVQTAASHIAYCTNLGPYAAPGALNPDTFGYRLHNGDTPDWLEPIASDDGLQVLRVR